VTDPEPLPPENSLWDAPRCLITPHIAGGTQDETQKLVDHFVDNFNRFIAGAALVNQVI
jgi:phosphoglycerate dehydrogenase-like enzyme